MNALGTILQFTLCLRAWASFWEAAAYSKVAIYGIAYLSKFPISMCIEDSIVPASQWEKIEELLTAHYFRSFYWNDCESLDRCHCSRSSNWSLVHGTMLTSAETYDVVFESARYIQNVFLLLQWEKAAFHYWKHSQPYAGNKFYLVLIILLCSRSLWLAK